MCYILLDYKIYVKGSLKNWSACVCIDPLRAMSQSCTSVYLCTRWGTANCFSNAMYTRRRHVSWSLLFLSLYQRYEKGNLSPNMASSHVIVTSHVICNIMYCICVCLVFSYQVLLCVVSSSYVLETLCVYIVVSGLSLSTKCHHCVSMCNSRIVFLTVFVLNPASVLFLIDCLSEVC